MRKRGKGWTIGVMKAVAFILQALCHIPAILTLGEIAPTPIFNPAAIDFIMMEEIVDPKPAEALFGVKFEALESGLRKYVTIVNR